MPKRSGLSDEAIDLIKQSLLDPDTSFLEYCNRCPRILGEPGTQLRRQCQRKRDNLSRKGEFQSPERIRRRAETMPSKPRYSEAWATRNEKCETFDLDLDDPSAAAGGAQYFAVHNCVVGDNNENICAKIVLQHVIEDFDDYEKNLYSAQLEIDGKGIFVFLPKAPAYFYETPCLPNENEQHHQARNAKARLFEERQEEDLSEKQRVLYFKFTDGMRCDNSYFNDDVLRNDSCGLQNKVLVPIYRRHRELLEKNGYPFQLIWRVSWEVVITESIAKLQKDKDTGIEDELSKLFSGMEFQGNRFPPPHPNQPPPYQPPASGKQPPPLQDSPKASTLFFPSVSSVPLDPMPKVPISPPRMGVKQSNTSDHIKNRASERALGRAHDIREAKKSDNLAKRRGLAQEE